MTQTVPMPDWDELLGELERLRHETITERNVMGWLERWSEVQCQVRDAWLSSLWATYQDSRDEAAQSAYKTISQEIFPQLERPNFLLREKLVKSGIENAELEPLLRLFRADVAIFRKANTPLFAEERALVKQYENIVSKQMVQLDQPVTVQKAQNLLKTTRDRAERERIWRKIEEVRAQDHPILDELFIKLVSLRQQIARNAGYDNYLEYVWTAKHRFDYSLEDALRLMDNIAEVFADVQMEAGRYRAECLGVDKLMPWDLDIDLEEGAYRNTKLSERDYIDAAKTAYGAIKPEFAEIIEQMVQSGHVSLSSTEGKVSGNMATYFSGTGQPSIKCNLGGHITDLRVVLHEFGHAIHFSYSSRNNLFWLKANGSEINEFVAYTFQTLTSGKLADGNVQVLTKEELANLQYFVFEFVLSLFTSVRNQLRLEHWIYTQDSENLSATNIRAAYLRLTPPGWADWSKLTEPFLNRWKARHIFLRASYNIEYAIAWIATLNYLYQYEKAAPKRIAQYIDMLSHGGKKSVRESLQLVQIDFPFNDKSLTTAKKTFVRKFMEDVLKA